MVRPLRFVCAIIVSGLVIAGATTDKGPVDPGVRSGPTSAGQPLSGLTADETAFFQDGAARFVKIDTVTGGPFVKCVLNGIQTAL
jgi:hypothetical protein